MTHRKGFILTWITARLVTLTVDGQDYLPVLESAQSARDLSSRIPIPPHGVLGAMEVLVDEEGRFKQSTAGGGFADLELDWSRLEPLWESEPTFEAIVSRGVDALRAREGADETG